MRPGLTAVALGPSIVSLNTNNPSSCSGESLDVFWDVGSKPVRVESSCLLHESRTNIIVRMDLRSLVELAHDSAGRVNMREELDRPRRPPTGGARGFFLGVRALAKMGVRPSPTGH